MLRLFRRKRKKVDSPPANRIRLSLESLESRDCPSGSDPTQLFVGPLGDSGGTVLTSTETPPPPDSGASMNPPPTMNQPPCISLNIVYDSQKNVTLSGQVTDENPGGLTVTFTGQYQGTVVTNADGTFSVTVTAAGLGTISASTVDTQGLSSNVAFVSVISFAPQITEASCTEGIDHIWTFRGKVLDESAPNLVIHFGGLNSVENQTVTVEADGWFCYIVQLQPNEDGTVTADTTDWWGQASNTMNYIVREG